MQIKIPESHVAPLVRLLKMSQKEQQALHAAIEATPLGVEWAGIQKAISVQEGIAADEVQAFATFLVSMALASSDRTKDGFVDAVCAALPSAAGEEFDPEQLARLGESLAALLSTESLVVSAKAGDVMTSHQRIFHSCRILTDIRPIYASDPAAGPSAAVAIHSLRIRFTEMDQPQEFYVALDKPDLKDLRSEIERALSKDGSMREMLGKAGFEVLGS